MSIRERFSGVWVALVTPWDRTAGRLKEGTVSQLVARFAQAGVRGLFILGTTGEGTLLSPAERMRFAECVLSESEGVLPVIVHTGHDRPRVVVELSRHAKRLGAVAVAVAPPTRYRLDQKELLAHYLEVARAVEDLPLFLYDIPGTTGNPLGSELLAELRRHTPNVVGAKVSRTDWEAWEGYLGLSDKVTLFVGVDEMALPLLLLGGQGLVCSGANILPELYVALFRAAREGDAAKGAALQRLVTELCHACHRGSPLAYIKTAVSLLGWDVGPTLPPLRELSPTERSELEARLTLIRKKAEEFSAQRR